MISSHVLGTETLEELSLFLYKILLLLLASFVAIVPPGCIFLLTTNNTSRNLWRSVLSKYRSFLQEEKGSVSKTNSQPTECNLDLANSKSVIRHHHHHHHHHHLELHSAIERKKKFINSKHGKGYGYSSTPKGHIDMWRKSEFPTLIRPIPLLDQEQEGDTDIKQEKEVTVSTNRQSANDDELEVYLDYAGSAIASKTLLKAMYHHSIENQILGNPHSNGPSASRTQESMEQVKKQVLDFFDANAGPMYGFSHEKLEYHGESLSSVEEHEEEDYHPGYDVIFTSGTTHALQIIAENFDWDNGSGTMDGKTSTLLYSQNSHTSVIGMREPAMQRGASFRCEKMGEIANAGPNDFDGWGDFANEETSYAVNSTTAVNTNIKHLLVFPLECNFGGEKNDARSIIKNSRAATQSGKWYTLLDIAKAASTEEIHLRRLDPDFACVSFYKIFGAPTGIGALLVKRSSKGAILNTRFDSSGSGLKGGNRQYFGGGSVDIVLPGKDFRKSPCSLHSLVHGTINFRSILSLRPCFQELRKIGGLDEVSKHTQSLVLECVSRLRNLRHQNGGSIIEFYGQWSCHRDDNHGKDVPYKATNGSIITFNVLRSDRSYVGYNEVSKLASLYKTPIQLRTGCFCNPGACHEALNIAEEDAEDNYYKNGKVCGDHLDVIDGVPTGAVRISIGKDSIWEDIDVVARFLEITFKDKTLNPSETDNKIYADKSQSCVTDKLRLANIYIFPIKSCGAMEVNRWEMNLNTGNLLYDREFALIDASGMALRLCRYPKMGSIRPQIDLKKKILSVSAPGRPTLWINLDTDLHHPMSDIKVCGNKCDGKLWGSYAVSAWFSEYLGVRCWLARANINAKSQPLKQSGEELNSKSKSRVGFENEAPLLLLSTNSLDILNNQLRLRGSHEVNAKFFRANLVVETEKSSDNTNPEDLWATIKIPRSVTELEVTGQCARCSMVDVDPESGMRGKTLSTLAEYRRNKGQITFGIFLRVKGKHQGSENTSIWIEKGDVLSAKRLC